MQLRQAREQHFLNQRELAEKAGVSRATIIAVETGKNRPYTATMRRIAQALDIDPGDIDWPLRPQPPT